MKARIKALVAVLLCVALLAPAGVSAAGYENIGGAVHGIYYYGNPREITNPSSPGAEVAFKQYSGGYVELGIHG